MRRHRSLSGIVGLAVLICTTAAGRAGESGATRDPRSRLTAGPSEEARPLPSTVAPAASYALPWYSINGGGAIGSASLNYRSSQSIGQSVAGHSQSASYGLGIGFWYGVGTGGACPIAVSGDVNLNGTVTSADIIYLVNHVFKGGAAPLPCAASGDVNCSGALTSADIIGLVNYVFKGGSPPCNTCTSSLASEC